MAKVKNKRNSGLADIVNNKRKGQNNKKKVNPFEVHINREKLKVLGKKAKHDRGLPGVSRAKAIQKRKETLGTEMKIMNKTNTFIDRRIGEKNDNLSSEDRMIARFTAERARQNGKKNIYNLADDEILTHRGQTLEQIEKFDDPRSSDDEDDYGRKGFGGLADEFVSEGHFGGGTLSKTESKDGAKSHKDLIEQLIAESKKRKAEKQKEKEQTLDLTEKLDSEWKDLQPVVFKKARMEEKKEESLIDKLLLQAEKKGQDYDKMMRELKFEKRGTPSDGLKSDEKQAKEEKERLEKLELERQQRMLGDEEDLHNSQPNVGKHRSADDLDDNFELDDAKEYMLAYDKDGNPLMPEHVLKDKFVPPKPDQQKFEDGVSDTSSEEDNDDDADDENNEGSDTTSDKLNEPEKDQSEKEDSSDDSDDHTALESENKIQAGSDKTSSSDNGQESDGELVESEVEKGLKKTIANNGTEIGVELDDEISDSDHEKKDIHLENEPSDTKSDFNKLDDLAESDDESGSEDSCDDENDKTDFNLDIQSDNIKALLQGKTPSQQSVAIQKLIKSHDPSLAEDNKEKLSKIFQNMLQYVNDIFRNLNEEADVIKSFLIFDKIAPYFYDIAHINKVSSKKFLADVLHIKHNKFNKHPKKIPDLDTLIFFKLISLLYPTSDFRHPITTPSLIFMSEILTTSKFRDAFSISRGLFITALILEYTVLSKRYVSAAINFIRGILYLAANTSVLNPIQVVPPFQLHKDAKLLYLDEDCSELEIGYKMGAKDLVLNEIDKSFKIRCVYTSMLMLREFFNNCNDMEAQECIFEPHLKLLGRIDLDLYPKKVASTILDTVQFMKQSLEVKTYTPLCREKKRPKALRLYEPDIQEVFTGSKSAKLSRENAEKKRLEHKYKREMKGALREIRRDKAYIANVKMKQKLQSDNIRKEKVKQIYKDASVQQGELNKLKRMK